MKIDHSEWDRPSNHLSPIKYTLFTRWMSAMFRREFDWDVITTGIRTNSHNRSKRFFLLLLGKQDTTATFEYRNWIWCRPEKGWLLYVDTRGPAFHIRQGASEAEIWAAFEDFRAIVDAFFLKFYLTQIDPTHWTEVMPTADRFDSSLLADVPVAAGRPDLNQPQGVSFVLRLLLTKPGFHSKSVRVRGPERGQLPLLVAVLDRWFLRLAANTLTDVDRFDIASALVDVFPEV